MVSVADELELMEAAGMLVKLSKEGELLVYGTEHGMCDIMEILPTLSEHRADIITYLKRQREAHAGH